MALDIGTKKKNKNQPLQPSRWFRLAPPKTPDLPEFDNIMDFYWGGPERRITGITIRIIAVNAVALLILMFGILYLGQYQNNLINARLETFESELALIATALSEGALENETGQIVSNEAAQMVVSLAETTQQRIRVFDTNGTLIADSLRILGPDVHNALTRQPDRNGYHSLHVLKEMAVFILSFLPDRRTLPHYPKIENQNAFFYPDAPEALKGKISVSAWQHGDIKVFLSAAAPLVSNNTLKGAVLLTREGREIEEDIGRVWADVLKIFIGTLIFTIFLSIYLSGVIARPLRKLAKATEAVRRGQARAEDIPDYSHRYDEIGELSLAFKQMTSALWDRMDSIEQFAADVSHELKNPLTSLRSAVETASIVKKQGDRKKLMDIIKHDVERLDRLITDISNASRIDAELSREAFEQIDLKKLLHNLLDTYSKPLERINHKENHDGDYEVDTGEHNISMVWPGKKNIAVWGFETRLAQVFQNLLSNAISFSKKGKNIKISVTAGRGRATITIEDEGSGIPPNKLETVFERFYSERPEHEGYGHHSGLGLSICKQIIDAHGGTIYAENIRGEDGKIGGARFTVILNTVI